MREREREKVITRGWCVCVQEAEKRARIEETAVDADKKIPAKSEAHALNERV